MEKIISWWSGGITSAVACKIAIDIYGKDNSRVIMIDTKNEHPDTYRFKKDCEDWYGIEIEVITGIGEKYGNIFDVWRKHKSLNTATGAICSTNLKRLVREKWEKSNTYRHQVFGFEFDKKEMNRALSMTMNHGERTKAIYPLLLMGYDKKDCIKIVEDAGIKIPEMYLLGFQNNNPCTLDTEIVTFEGVKRIGDIVGTKQVLLNRTGWVFADITHMGTQPVLNLEVYKKGLETKNIRFTPDHKWYGVRRGTHAQKKLETKDLKVGDVLPMISIEKLGFTLDKDYFLRGVVIGDGSVTSNSTSNVRLFKDKIEMMKDLGYEVKMRPDQSLGYISSLPLEYKTDMPELLSMDYHQRCSLLAGLVATDGSVNVKGQACLSTSDNLDYFISLIESIGISITSLVDNTNKGRNHNKKGTLIKATKPNTILNFRAPEDLILRPKHKTNFRKIEDSMRGWRIKSITSEVPQEVACATVLNSDPEFVIKGGIVTGNCFGTGCVQGGIGYWQKMRDEFPDKFDVMADMEHELTELKGEPVTMLKDQSNEAKVKMKIDPKAHLVFLKKHPLYPDNKCLEDMPLRKVEPLFECNGMCGVNDLSPRSQTENEIAFE